MGGINAQITAGDIDPETGEPSIDFASELELGDAPGTFATMGGNFTGFVTPAGNAFPTWEAYINSIMQPFTSTSSQIKNTTTVSAGDRMDMETAVKEKERIELEKAQEEKRIVEEKRKQEEEKSKQEKEKTKKQQQATQKSAQQTQSDYEQASGTGGGNTTEAEKQQQQQEQSYTQSYGSADYYKDKSDNAGGV